MSEVVGYFKVSNLPIVDEVPEGATVLAYNEGQLMRVDGSKVGGGGITCVRFTGNTETMTFACTHTYSELRTLVLSGDIYVVKMFMPVDATGENGSDLIALAVECTDADIIRLTFMFNGQLVTVDYNSNNEITPS